MTETADKTATTPAPNVPTRSRSWQIVGPGGGIGQGQPGPGRDPKEGGGQTNVLHTKIRAADLARLETLIEKKGLTQSTAIQAALVAWMKRPKLVKEPNRGTVPGTGKGRRARVGGGLTELVSAGFTESQVARFEELCLASGIKRRDPVTGKDAPNRSAGLRMAILSWMDSAR